LACTLRAVDDTWAYARYDSEFDTWAILACTLRAVVLACTQNFSVFPLFFGY